MRRIVIEHAYATPCFRRHGCSSYPTRASSNHNHIKSRGHSVTTSICGMQTIWHVRQWGMPFTVARHSMQIPIPHSGARASCRTENLVGSLAIIMAAATLVPCATQTGRPLIVI
jgi:hypothetical protein